MKKFKIISGIIVLLIILLSVNHVLAEDSKKDAGKMIDEMAALYMDNMKIPGLAIAISMPDGKVIEKYYGKANIEYNAPVEKDTIFPIGSLYKTHTAIAIMLLKEQWKLDVNDKITKYFPDCVAWEKVTIKNLMQHTSGIKSITAVEPFCSNQMKDWKPEEIVAILKPLKLDFEPGTNAQYSNSGCILLAIIVEKVSGMTYNDFLQKNIAGPLGMTHTIFVSNRIIVPKRASGYMTVDNKTQNAEYASTLAPFGSGGIVSKVTDILKLKDAFRPGKILKKESIDEMFATTKLNDGRDYIIPGPIGITYGYCLETLIAPDGQTVPGKAGSISGFKSQFLYFKDRGIFIAITANLDMMSPAVGEKLKGFKMIDCPLPMSLQLFEIVK
ncbi:MAG: serine hydrolase [Proteobacteria bacterium]|nr:serine hydrolase [Pseudomonadota bacterium]